MKNLLFAIVILLTSFSQKDKEPPVIESVRVPGSFSLLAGDMPITACASDNVGVFQIILQIDPIGKTWPAGTNMDKNKAFWQETDLYIDCYTAYAELEGLEPGEHTLRVTVYDRARNETSEEITFLVN